MPIRDSITGNKGEWSELYAFFRLAAEGRLYAANADINRIDEVYYDILKIIRLQTDGNWEYYRDKDIVVISANSGEPILRISTEEFSHYADILFKDIKDSVGSSFALPQVWSFARKVKCNALKARSSDKSDIELVVHDYMTGSKPLLGFSIKSQLGSPATLLNASKATNFMFKLKGHLLSDNEIEKFKSIRKFNEKFDYLRELGSDIEFAYVENEIFKENLMMIDTMMPCIMASLIKKFYEVNGVSKIEELLQLCVEENVCKISPNQVEKFYKHKIKELLTNIALGMVPATSWNGYYEATGGYIIVKTNGDVLCYHIYNRNGFRDYLFNNTKLDTPSSSRYKLGIIEVINNEQYTRLNLQIRFIR